MQEQLTTRQVAELLGVEVWRVQRLFELGVLPEPPRFAGRRVVSGDMIPAIVDGLRSRNWLPAGGRSRPKDHHDPRVLTPPQPVAVRLAKTGQK